MVISRLLIILLLLASTVEAKNLYVNNSGSPACSDATTYANNDASNPWCTILRSVWGNTTRSGAGTSAQAAAAGDTVYITSGTYDDQSGWNGGNDPLYKPVNAGSAGNRITIKSLGGTVTLTSGPTLTTNSGVGGATIGAGTDYVTWDGFTMNQWQNRYRYGQAMVSVYGVHYFELLNSVITGTEPLVATDVLGDQHNGVLAIGGSGSSTCDGDMNGLTIRNNTITGFKREVPSSSRNSNPITIYCVGDNMTITHNEFSHATGGGIHAKSAYNSSANIEISYNYIHDTIYGIDMQGHTDWHVHHNLIANNTRGYTFHNTIYYFDYPATRQPNDFYVVNNTFYNNTTAFYFKSLCGNLNNNFLQNNIVYGSNRIIEADNAECESVANMGTDNVAFNYNSYNYSGYFYCNDGCGGSVASYATWTSTYGQDANTTTGTNPIFVDAAGGDFRLCTGSGTPDAGCSGASPAINAGIDILDLDGDASTVDAITLGAYITGNEVIGVDNGTTIPTRTISAPGSLRWLFMGTGSRTIQLLQ